MSYEKYSHERASVATFMDSEVTRVESTDIDTVSPNSYIEESLVKIFRTIVVMQNKKVIGTGSVWITQCDNQRAGNIGQLMIHDSYPEPVEIIHRLLFCIECIAFAHKCNQTVLKGSVVKNYKDLVTDLDYFSHLRSGKTYFIKMAECQK